MDKAENKCSNERANINRNLIERRFEVIFIGSLDFGMIYFYPWTS